MHWPEFKQELFPGQQADERVHLVLRVHWIQLASRIAIWLIFASFLAIGDWIIAEYIPLLQTAPYVGYVDLAKNLYLMFLVLGLLIIWVMYYLNIQIITNERIVDITQRSLIHHTTSELHLSRIEDVTAEVSGVFGTLLDYGHVYVQTAGETERFIFHQVPNPQALVKLILDLYEQLPKEDKVKE